MPKSLLKGLNALLITLPPLKRPPLKVSAVRCPLLDLLPYPVLIHLLKTILHSGDINSFWSLLTASTLLANHVLIITDTLKKELPVSVRQISVSDYNPSSELGKFPIKILQLYEVDTLTVQYDQTLTPTSLYGRLINTKDTFVHIYSFSPNLSVGPLALKRIAKKCGAPTPMEYRKNTTNMSSIHANLSSGDQLTTLYTAKHGRCQTFDIDTPDLKGKYGTWYFANLRHVTSLSIQGTVLLKERRGRFIARHAANVQIHYNEDCFDVYTNHNGELTSWSTPFISLLGSKLSNVRISFQTPHIPHVYLFTRQNLELTLINENWGYLTPYGQQQDQAHSSNISLTVRQYKTNPVSSLKLVGVQDKYAFFDPYAFVFDPNDSLGYLRSTSHLHWERLCCTKVTTVSVESIVINTPNLESLKIVSVVRDITREPESEIMVRFSAPKLRLLTLVGLRDSDSAWDIERLLNWHLPPLLKTVHIASMTMVEGKAPDLTWRDLRFISPAVESLYLKGYCINFGVPFFPKLRYLWLDITHLDKTLIIEGTSCEWSNTSSILQISLPTANFPNLESLSLYVSPKDFSWHFESNGLKDLLDLNIPSTCKSLEMSSLIQCQMRVNGEMLDEEAMGGIVSTGMLNTWKENTNGVFSYEGVCFEKKNDDQWMYDDSCEV